MAYLTKKQKAVYDYLKEYIENHGFAPSVLEMCEHFGKASLNTMHKYLVTLEEKGFLKRTPYRNRSIEILERNDEKKNAFDVPVLGYITDGEPIILLDKPDSIEIPEVLLKSKSLYALIVKGNYMITEGIRDGDYILVEPSNRIDNDALVILSNGREKVILRKIFKRKDYLMIQTTAPGTKPEIVENEKVLNILGVITGVFRNFSKESL